jgi:hypothetical protein
MHNATTITNMTATSHILIKFRQGRLFKITAELDGVAHNVTAQYNPRLNRYEQAQELARYLYEKNHGASVDVIHTFYNKKDDGFFVIVAEHA